jgi:hypothetical protein
MGFDEQDGVGLVVLCLGAIFGPLWGIVVHVALQGAGDVMDQAMESAGRGSIDADIAAVGLR